MALYDAAAQRRYNIAYRQKHPDKIRDNSERQRVSHRETKAKLKQIQVDRGCLRCGLTDRRCLQWHHRNPKDKSFNIGEIKNMRWERLMEEIAKCDVLCANCHFIVEDELRNA